MSDSRSSFPHGLVAVVVGVLVSACGDAPTEVVFEVIAEAEFAPGLNIDLSTMAVTPAGTYWKDEVVGTGPELVLGATATVAYTGWLTNGFVFDSQPTAEFEMGDPLLVPGFTDGLVGMLVGGTRLIIIPPELGYGAAGRSPVPPGAIMIFQVELMGVG